MTFKFKKGDKVVIISGKDSGKESTIAKSMPRDNQVVVDGCNLYKKHMKPTNDKKGEIVDVSKPIAASNVMHICPKTKKRTKISYKDVSGKKKRVARVSGELID